MNEFTNRVATENPDSQIQFQSLHKTATSTTVTKTSTYQKMEFVEMNDGQVFGVDQMIEEQHPIAGVNGVNIHPNVNNVLPIQEPEQQQNPIDHNNNQIDPDHR